MPACALPPRARTPNRELRHSGCGGRWRCWRGRARGGGELAAHVAPLARRLLKPGSRATRQSSPIRNLLRRSLFTVHAIIDNEPEAYSCHAVYSPVLLSLALCSSTSVSFTNVRSSSSLITLSRSFRCTLTLSFTCSRARVTECSVCAVRLCVCAVCVARGNILTTS